MRNQHTEEEHYILRKLCIVDSKSFDVQVSQPYSRNCIIIKNFFYKCDHGKQTLGSVFNTILLKNPWVQNFGRAR